MGPEQIGDRFDRLVEGGLHAPIVAARGELCTRARDVPPRDAAAGTAVAGT
jgi:hypothetical protein